MKFTYIAGLLGAASAVSVEQAPTEDNLVQMEAENLEAECKDFEQMDDDESLLELEGEEGEDKYNRANKYSYKAHYGKTKKQIDAQNHHILSTQKKCLSFVKKYRGHEKVCAWCKRAPAPAIRWRWIPSEKVWYRFYDGKWHYWGPSKNGFTSVGWTWYKGYWHHGGYVFKYVKGVWWRFQGKRWVKYGSRVGTKPGIPRGPRICRPFYILKKWGFPTSLATRSLPRCRVGAGKRALYYMWKDHKACKFLGGKLIYQKHKTCKSGKPHTWKRVIRCVQGPILSGKGLNYKTGRAFRNKHFGKRHSRKTLVLGGVEMGKCYYFASHKYWNLKKIKASWGAKVVAGMTGKKNTMTFTKHGKIYYYDGKHTRYAAWSKIPKKYRPSTAYYVIKGLAGKGISFMPAIKRGYFLGEYKNYSTPRWIRYTKSASYKNKHPWIPHKVKCV